MELLNEEFKRLEEFIQKINTIISPISFRDELKVVMDKTTRKQLSEKYPKCWIPVNMGNKENIQLPICNRNGSEDSRMIQFSMKLANRLVNHPDVDQGMLQITMKKLSRMNTTYSREILTTPRMGAKKANITKAMSTLKKNLDSIRGNQN